MNRADQAPEPSIEELLASIRLIISDADKQGSFQKEPRGAAAGQAASAPSEIDAGEVFDLTDELTFPEETVRPQPVPPHAAMPGQPVFDRYSGPQAHPAARRGAALPAPDGASAMMRGRTAQERFDPAHALHPDARKFPQAPSAGPAWPRRDPPADAGQPPIAPGRPPRQEQIAAQPPARNWAGDVQMPVPDQGPVSLYPSPPSKAQPEKPAAGDTGPANWQAAYQAEAPARPGDSEGPAAVAALAQRLARSAIGVLEASELENANQVDFEHLDAGSRAEVTEKFADAIECVAQAVQDEPAMAEVQVSQARRQEQPLADSAPAPAKEAPRDLPGEAVAKVEPPVQAEAKAALRADPEPVKAAPEPRPAPVPVFVEPVRQESTVQAAPVKQPAPPVAVAVQQPLAQAQFMGAAPAPVSAMGGSALEGVVRDMLRPLLVQWLNENMPRILENAIREEISMRGLLPKSDG